MRYCNTTDLYRAFPRIEEMKEAKTVRSFAVYSGSILKQPFAGYGEVLFEDGAKLTAAASAAAIVAGQFYYDSATDILYMQPSSGAFTTHAYRWGVDWATLKGWAADQGSAEFEALLDAKFPVPIPEDPNGSSSRRYAAPQVMAVAYFAASFIAGRMEPPKFGPNDVAENAAAELWQNAKRIVDRYNKGELRFPWETTADEVAGTNITPGASNTSVGIIQVRGEYAGADDGLYVLKCTTGGDVATAAFALSQDNGGTYGNADAYTSSYAWTALVSGLEARFFGLGGGSGAFVANDTWKLELTPKGRNLTRARIGSIRTIA